MGDGSLDRERALALLNAVLTNPAVRKIGHDIKADVIVLGRHGIRLQGLDLDTMLAAYLLDANRSSQALEPMALEQLGYKAIDVDEVRGKGTKARQAPASVPTSRCKWPTRLRRRLASKAWSRSTATSSCRWCPFWRAWSVPV
jgi:DNA polymerase I-like protein with 3'-5' exonuclease and polymerase domains